MVGFPVVYIVLYVLFPFLLVDLFALFVFVCCVPLSVFQRNDVSSSPILLIPVLFLVILVPLSHCFWHDMP